jgi:hypothetical protein
MNTLVKFGVPFSLLFALILRNAGAGEIPAGTVVSAENLGQLENESFDGHRLGDLLTDNYKMWIRDYKLTLRLRHSEPVQVDSRYAEFTAKYAGQPRLNPETKRVENFTAGVPFPNIDLSDPDAGYKVIWNNYYANPVIGDTWIAQGYRPDTRTIVQTSIKDGIWKFTSGGNYKFLMEGRVSGGPHMFGDGTVHKIALLGLTYPYDVAGLGLYQIQYNTGQPDDVWIYIKSIRRIRRISGEAAWTDPQPGLDLLNDDNQGIDAFPPWYQNFKLVEKRWILAVVHGTDPSGDKREVGERIELSPPYWNPINIEWEPREVYVIEATPPSYHPYSKKIIYMDAEFPTNHQMEAYDKKGDLWRIWQQAYHANVTADGYPSIGYVHSLTVDFQYQRATYIPLMDGRIWVNPPGIKQSDFRPEALSKMAAGQNPFTLE